MACADTTSRATVDGRALPPGWVLVTASGVCCLCDSRFEGERVLAWPDATVRGDWIFVELRHLDQRASALRKRALDRRCEHMFECAQNAQISLPVEVRSGEMPGSPRSAGAESPGSG
jgi:hypothetical protein